MSLCVIDDDDTTSEPNLFGVNTKKETNSIQLDVNEAVLQ